MIELATEENGMPSDGPACVVLYLVDLDHAALRENRSRIRSPAKAMPPEVPGETVEEQGPKLLIVQLEIVPDSNAMVDCWKA